MLLLQLHYCNISYHSHQITSQVRHDYLRSVSSQKRRFNNNDIQQSSVPLYPWNFLTRGSGSFQKYVTGWCKVKTFRRHHLIIHSVHKSLISNRPLLTIYIETIEYPPCPLQYTLHQLIKISHNHGADASYSSSRGSHVARASADSSKGHQSVACSTRW